MPYAPPQPCRVPPLAGDTIRADCEGSALSSAVGALWLRGLDRQLGLTARRAAAVQAPRHPSSIAHKRQDKM
jgi:hypothetical protein